REDDREHDHRHAGEVRGDVAPVAVIGRVLREIFLAAFHAREPLTPSSGHPSPCSESSVILKSPNDEPPMPPGMGFFARSPAAGMMPELPSSRPRFVAESAFARPSSLVILLERTRRKRSCSKF